MASAAARIAWFERSVSDTWNVMPMVNARYAKSTYRGRSF